MGIFSLYFHSPIPVAHAAPIALDTSALGTANGFFAGPKTVATGSMTLAANAVLVCEVAIFQDVSGTGQVDSITFNGVSGTLGVASAPPAATTMRNEIWYWKTPTTGSALTASVTVNANTDGIKIHCASFTGVDQTAPLGVTNTSNGGSGNPAVSITTGTANSVSIASLSRHGNTAITATTFTNVSRANLNNVTSLIDYNLNTTATTYTATETGTAAQDWTMAVIELKPAAGGGGGGGSPVGTTFISAWWW